MQIIRGFEAIETKIGPCAVTMGNFDGVHLGHRALLEALIREARKNGLLACVITFYPHPLKVLAPERAPIMIETLDQRIEDIEMLNPDVLIIEPFTLKLSQVTAEEFIHRFLIGKLRCSFLIVGGDARFGHGRHGDVEMLKQMSDNGLFNLQLIEPVKVDEIRVSSSAIRRMIMQGDVYRASRFLGKPLKIVGEVVAGAGRGKSLGFPTANIIPDNDLIPKEGVYACVAEIGIQKLPCAVHIGPIPTFGDTRRRIEAHVIGFSGDLLHSRMKIGFLKRLRDVIQFSDPTALKIQISRDVEETKVVYDHCDVY